MPTLNEIDKVLSEVAQADLSESWDNDGVMLCANGNISVKKVLIALDVNKAVIDYAANNNFDVIISHHPFIFNPLSRIVGDEYALIEKLIKSNISVLSYHTRMDSSEQGVNVCVAQLLELQNVRGFGGESGKIGRIGELKKPMKPSEFAEFLKNKFGCGTIRASVFDTDENLIKTCAVVGGAGKSFMYEAVKAGADAFVTSEAAHNTFIDAKANNICLFDCGHYYTENPVCFQFKKILEQSFGNKLNVEIFDVESPYINL